MKKLNRQIEVRDARDDEIRNNWCLIIAKILTCVYSRLNQ